MEKVIERAQFAALGTLVESDPRFGPSDTEPVSWTGGRQMGITSHNGGWLGPGIGARFPRQRIAQPLGTFVACHFLATGVSSDTRACQGLGSQAWCFRWRFPSQAGSLGEFPQRRLLPPLPYLSAAFQEGLGGGARAGNQFSRRVLRASVLARPPGLTGLGLGVPHGLSEKPKGAVGVACEPLQCVCEGWEMTV